MREITGLTDKVLGLNGKALTLEDDGRHEATVLEMLVQFISGFRGATAKQDVKAVKLARRLVDWHTDAIVVEEQELEILSAAVEQNRLGFPAVVRAPVYLALTGAKEVANVKTLEVI